MAFEGMATPLGVKPGSRQQGIPPLWRWWLLAAFFVITALLVLIASLKWSSDRAVPGAVAVIERASEVIVARPAGAGDGTRDRARADSSEAVGREQRSIAPGGGLVIKVPEAAGPPSEPIFDQRVGEKTDQGVLPVVSASGHKAYKLYSRPFVASDKPAIAIVMTGVGISPRGTEAAVRKLPAEVTLAFAPYGRDLAAAVNSARGEGHEILLQVPMEPQDYPRSDPGPHTLRVGDAQKENVARLRWLMSRFTGYVGLTNYMGSRLMRDPQAYGPLLEEINRRGLLFLDDGTTSGALTAGLGKKMNLPSLMADRVMETGGLVSLDQILAEAEQTARAKGHTVISVPALPANIDRIAAFAKEVKGRGLVLAPISAIIGRNAPRAP